MSRVCVMEPRESSVLAKAYTCSRCARAAFMAPGGGSLSFCPNCGSPVVSLGSGRGESARTQTVGREPIALAPKV